ncbi:MAG: hypothetical protein QOE48_992 [Mycobacterium sp.]|jgi:hypothetical protein|nr:hypothetical protein [Mycobacterium sp.]MDT5305324.1 hypothetical protein [Mycobacterium sp.]MDT7738227.1 hypothetical protein [Mycobacterium sp.]
MVELYRMSLLHVIDFSNYGTDARASAAAADLSTLSDFRGPKVGGKVTPQTLFRYEYPGCTTGPLYFTISLATPQFRCPTHRHDDPDQ